MHQVVCMEVGWDASSSIQRCWHVLTAETLPKYAQRVGTKPVCHLGGHLTS